MSAIKQKGTSVFKSEGHIEIRAANTADLEQLLDLEARSFSTDRLSRRSFQHWLKAKNCVFLVTERDAKIVAYGLLIMRKGTHLARLYSIAVDEQMRGLGIGKDLILAIERKTLQQNKLFIRLEVAKTNASAIKLYESLGYKVFGSYLGYYEDNTDALRMQKNVRQRNSIESLAPYPWYQQTTDFSCGPAALMMAMAKLDKTLILEQNLELDIWREATTIFMTSGHGGCHPLGLALAAEKRGLKVKVYINLDSVLFIKGVRSQHKKDIMLAVEQQFRQKVDASSIELCICEVTMDDLQAHLKQGASVISLISTYQLDDKKAPHWVTITEIDDHYLYVHDPDPDDHHVESIDCQHIPIAKQDFYTMSSFGKERLRTAIAIF
ncbi:MAG: ribosomal protein S18 acetylase RimI-like enzyme/predicted double-glycine peptidase [Paraglaciecola sp.]|jgi:ribosomal protein S18 acetylase RimI-like enzyme/predicted double-glycine peptidase